MSSAGGHSFSDVSGRMQVFGRHFAREAGIPDPSQVATAEALLEVVERHLPRGSAGADETAILEAAGYVGEWVRTRAKASWIAEGPFEPHLQLADPAHAIVYLLPVVQILRTASSAGFDGVADQLVRVLNDVQEPAQASSLEELRIDPPEDREAVVAWVRANRAVRKATRAALWRRCSVCSSLESRELTIHRPSDDWEGEAADAAGVLSADPFVCPCGGPPGSATRFLMLRHHEGKLRLGDIYVANTRTRVGCWTLEGENVEPFDALALTTDEMFG